MAAPELALLDCGIRIKQHWEFRKIESKVGPRQTLRLSCFRRNGDIWGRKRTYWSNHNLLAEETWTQGQYSIENMKY